MVLDVNLHDPKYFELGIYFISIESIVNLRSWLRKNVENHQYYVMLSYLKQQLDIYVFNVAYLHRLLRYVYLFEIIFVNIDCLAL